MSEPQLDRLFARLGDSGFSPAQLGSDRELLENLVWYCCDERRAESTLEKLNQEKPEKRKSILASLGSLYPLSRLILMQALKKVQYADEFFCMGSDPGKTVLGTIKKMLDEMARKSRLTSETLNYQEEVQRLEKEVQRLKPLQEEKAACEQKLLALKAQANRQELEDEIRSLKDEIKNFENRTEILRMDRDEIARRREELAAEEEAIKNELASLQTGADRNRLELLRKLFQSFPADHEES